jgi:hypothetical protein
MNLTSSEFQEMFQGLPTIVITQEGLTLKYLRDRLEFKGLLPKKKEPSGGRDGRIQRTD